MKNKNVYVIAGSNGSGKTTFARRFLPEYVHCPRFVNADLIAQGLSPFDPNKAALTAGKLVVQQIQDFARQGVDFGFETTLSGRSYVKYLKKFSVQGYQLHLFFLWIPTADLALSRIKERVFEGGHHVPEDDVRRRFSRSLSNFFSLYNPLFTSWMIFNNTGIRPALIAKAKNGRIGVVDRILFEAIKNEASQ